MIVTADTIFDLLGQPTATEPYLPSSSPDQAVRDGCERLLEHDPDTALASLTRHGWNNRKIHTLVIPAIVRDRDPDQSYAASTIATFLRFLDNGTDRLLPNLSELIFISATDRPGRQQVQTSTPSSQNRRLLNPLGPLTGLPLTGWASPSMRHFIHGRPDLRVTRCADHPHPSAVESDVKSRISSVTVGVNLGASHRVT